jgi:hypothetical protein
VTATLVQENLVVGQLILCSTAAPDDATRLTALLRAFFYTSDPDGGTPSADLPVLHLSLAPQPLPPPACPGTPVMQTAGLTVRRTETLFYLVCRTSSLTVDPVTGRAWGHLDATFWQAPVQAQRDFLMLALLAMAHRHRRYGLHANGLRDDNTQLLIVGPSGSGKTSLALSLLARGWRHLGDDVVLLRPQTDGVDALAFRRDFGCTETTRARFAALAQAPPRCWSRDRSKWFLDADSLHPGQQATTMRPQVLFFARLGHCAFTQLEPVHPTDALLELIPLSAALMTDVQRGAHHLAALGQLVDQARAHRLVLGEDVFTHPAAVARLLQEA